MDLEYIIKTTSRMEVGQRFVISHHGLRNLGADNFLTGETAIDRMKSNIIGSSWQFLFSTDPMSGDITIERIEPDGKRRHVDHDRRHLFNEPADGVYTLREG